MSNGFAKYTPTEKKNICRPLKIALFGSALLLSSYIIYKTPTFKPSNDPKTGKPAYECVLRTPSFINAVHKKFDDSKTLLAILSVSSAVIGGLCFARKKGAL
jgi:hypothetical protein